MVPGEGCEDERIEDKIMEDMIGERIITHEWEIWENFAN